MVYGLNPHHKKKLTGILNTEQQISIATNGAAPPVFRIIHRQTERAAD